MTGGTDSTGCIVRQARLVLAWSVRANATSVKARADYVGCKLEGIWEIA